MCFRVIIFSALCLPIFTNGYDISQLEKDISDTFSCHGNPALTVSIVKDGEVVLATGFGVTDVDSKVAVTNETLFGVASLSKAFATTLIAKLLLKTNYTIETPLREILGPEFKIGDELRTKYATLEDLMSHRMGMNPSNKIRFDDNLTRESLLHRVRYMDVGKSFRGSYTYSNIMYGLLTAIAEKLGGKTWEELVREEIYEPLDMKSSSFSTIQDLKSSNVAQGYTIVSDNFVPYSHEFTRRWSLLCGSGCVMSNAVDMANWMMFHLSKGKNRHGEQILDEDITADMGNPRTVAKNVKYYQSPTFPRTTSMDSYALGWFVGYYNGLRIQWHSGSTFCYRALMTLYPDYNLGIFTALTGRDDDYKYRIALHNYITDKLLDRESWLNVSTICSFPQPWAVEEIKNVTENTFIPSSLNTSAYVGIYTNMLYGNLTVSYNETVDQLVAQYGYSISLLRRIPDDSNTTEYYVGSPLGIIYPFAISSFSFHVDMDGTVQFLTIPSFNSKVPPRFQKVQSHYTSVASRVASISFLSVLTAILVRFVA